MKEDEIIQNNRLIAEFMGTDMPDKFLEFNTCWNWLMGVVEKIESLDLSRYGYIWEGIEGETEYNNQDINVEIEGNRCWIYMNLQLDPMHTFNEESFKKKYESKLQATYESVVEFIHRYNEIISNNIHSPL